MLVVEFMKNLEDRYKGISRAVGQDISRFLENLDGETRQLLWNSFVDNYEFNTPPRRATFAKLLMKEGLYKKNMDNKKMYFGHCKKCNVSFPNHSPKCPLCGGDYILVVAEEMPSRLVKMHDSCASCQKFVPYETEGAKCDYWGKSNETWGLSGYEYKMQLEKCKTCPCKVCCRAERIYHLDWEMYKEMNEKGEFRDGWVCKIRS